MSFHLCIVSFDFKATTAFAISFALRLRLHCSAEPLAVPFALHLLTFLGLLPHIVSIQLNPPYSMHTYWARGTASGAAGPGTAAAAAPPPCPGAGPGGAATAPCWPMPRVGQYRRTCPG